MRYLSRKAGHYPENLETAALVDAIADQVHDLFMGLSCSRYLERYGFESLDLAAVSTVQGSLSTRVIPKHLAYFEKLLEKSSTGWLAGTETPSICDFALAPRLMSLPSSAEVFKDILVPFPKVVAFFDKFKATVAE
jgi:hypothetical protein